MRGQKAVKQRRMPGRPRLADGQAADQRLSIRFKRAELEALREQANLRGLELSVWLRSVILKQLAR